MCDNHLRNVVLECFPSFTLCFCYKHSYMNNVILQVHFSSTILNFQIGIVSIIVMSFSLSLLASEILPEDGSAFGKFYNGVDLLVTICFTVDLALNLIVNWYFLLSKSIYAVLR